MVRAVAVLLAAFLCLPLSAQDRPKRKRVSFSKIKRYIPAYFAASGKNRGKILERMKKAGLEDVRLKKTEFEWVRKVALAGNPKKTARSGRTTFDIDVDGRKHAITQNVPGNYDPRSPAPLIIALHGGSAETTTYEGSKKASRNQAGYWSPAAERIKAVVIAPSTTGFWTDKAGLGAIFQSIEHAKTNFNIDPDRIAVVGHSMGGFGIFEIGPAFADRFALMAPFVGGADATSKLANCRNLPFHIVIGAKDPMQYINTACRKNAKKLQDLGYDVYFKEHQDKGHDVISSEFPAVMTKLREKPRDLYARKLTRITGKGRWYWLEAPGRIEAEINGNTIKITGAAFAAYLSDGMVDLDKPVRILVDGEVKFEGKVERSLSFLLEHIEEGGDRGRIFAARVDLN